MHKLNTAAPLLALLLACVTEPAGAPESAIAGLDACVVARGRGFILTRRDVDELRRHFTPPPETAAAARFTLDVWLAEFIETGTIAEAPLRKRIEYHNRLSNRDLDARTEALAHARAKLNVVLGPCFRPATRSSPGA